MKKSMQRVRKEGGMEMKIFRCWVSLWRWFEWNSFFVDEKYQWWRRDCIEWKEEEEQPKERLKWISIATKPKSYFVKCKHIEYSFDRAELDGEKGSAAMKVPSTRKHCRLIKWGCYCWMYVRTCRWMLTWFEMMMANDVIIYQ